MHETIKQEGSLQRVQCLSGSALKLIALLTMIIDHVGVHLLKNIPACNEVWFSIPDFDCSIYGISRLIGRIAAVLWRHTGRRLIGRAKRRRALRKTERLRRTLRQDLSFGEEG